MATPKRRRCAVMAVHEYLAETKPAYRGHRERVERASARSVESGEALAVQRKLVTIQTVVHVVYRQASENISDAQIKSQFDVLNKDYSAANPDRSKVPGVWSSLVANPNVKFVLAGKDPNGKQTNGITRTKTTRGLFGAVGDPVKSSKSGGVPPWPSDRYLNLWVCNLADSLLGYAQFPGGPAATDGVVILNTAFGTTGSAAAPFNLGRTATHEIGHWLNLRHIWGDRGDCTGSDRVSDTPPCKAPNTGRPKFPHISCSNGPSGDMFMNYMDYVDDAAMFMFTAGQAARMNAALAGPRSSLWQ